MFIVARCKPHPRATLARRLPDLSTSPSPDLTGATEGERKQLLHVVEPGQEQRGSQGEWALGSQGMPRTQSQTALRPGGRLLLGG